MKRMTFAEWLAEAERRFGKGVRNWVFKCPMCHTAQSVADFHAAGLDKEKIQSVLGFSCIGRFMKSKGCDWTLGGLLQMHELEVVTEDGEAHPRFEFGERLPTPPKDKERPAKAKAKGDKPYTEVQNGNAKA